MFKGSYYFSGKGFQKAPADHFSLSSLGVIGAGTQNKLPQVAYVCLMLEKYYGREHSHTQSCANLLLRRVNWG